MNHARTGTAALVLGVATWAQLALAPAIAGGVDGISLFMALVALGALGAAARESRRSPPRAAALALAAYPTALGVAAFTAGRHAVPRFDAPSRVVAALTAAAFFACVIAWHGGHAQRVPVASAAADDRPRAPAPALRGVAFAALALVSAFVAVVAPAWIAAREPETLAERVAGEALVRGRGALVAAAGALLAVAVAVQGGSTLLRASPPRPRSPSRAAAYALWALCAYVMRHWLDRAR